MSRDARAAATASRGLGAWGGPPATRKPGAASAATTARCSPLSSWARTSRSSQVVPSTPSHHATPPVPVRSRTRTERELAIRRARFAVSRDRPTPPRAAVTRTERVASRRSAGTAAAISGPSAAGSLDVVIDRSGTPSAFASPSCVGSRTTTRGSEHESSAAVDTDPASRRSIRARSALPSLAMTRPSACAADSKSAPPQSCIRNVNELTAGEARVASRSYARSRRRWRSLRRSGRVGHGRHWSSPARQARRRIRPHDRRLAPR